MTHYSLSATVILKFLLFADVCSLPKTTMTKLSAKTVDQRAAMRVSFGSFNLLSPVDFFNPPFDPLPHRIGELLLLPLTTQRQSSAVINTTYYYYYYYLKLSHNQSEWAWAQWPEREKERGLIALANCNCRTYHWDHNTDKWRKSPIARLPITRLSPGVISRSPRRVHTEFHNLVILLYYIHLCECALTRVYFCLPLIITGTTSVCVFFPHFRWMRISSSSSSSSGISKCTTVHKFADQMIDQQSKRCCCCCYIFLPAPVMMTIPVQFILQQQQQQSSTALR